jgi:hypothetical protein
VRLVNTMQLCRLTSTPAGAIHGMRKAGILIPAVKRGEPSQREDGGGMPADLWHPMHALALIVSRGVRKRSVCVQDAGAILEFFWEMDPADLESEFSEGRDSLMIVGQKCAAVLMPNAAILEEASQHAATLENLGITASAVDVRKLWSLLCAEIDKLPQRKEMPCRN